MTATSESSGNFSIKGLAVRGLVKIHPGPVCALRGVDLEIPEGMFGLLGPNGAGKSTFMNIVAGLIEPTAGKVYLDGVDVVENPRHMRERLGYLPQDFGFYPDLSGRAMLEFLLKMKGVTGPRGRLALADELLERVNLTSAAKRKVGGYSGGMRQRLGLAQAIAGNPRVLIVVRSDGAFVGNRVARSARETDRPTSCRGAQPPTDRRVAGTVAPYGVHGLKPHLSEARRAEPRAACEVGSGGRRRVHGWPKRRRRVIAGGRRHARLRRCDRRGLVRSRSGAQNSRISRRLSISRATRWRLRPAPLRPRVARLKRVHRGQPGGRGNRRMGSDRRDPTDGIRQTGSDRQNQAPKLEPRQARSCARRRA